MKKPLSATDLAALAASASASEEESLDPATAERKPGSQPSPPRSALTNRRVVSADDVRKKASDVGATRNGDGTVSTFRTGRWTLDEKILFLYGLKKYGKGRWKKMSIYLPFRYVKV